VFHALEVSLQVIEALVPIEAKIRVRNRSLADQISRASESVALNLGEGRRRADGDRRRHWQFAAGSTAEVTVALRIAVAKRYVDSAELSPIEPTLDRLRRLMYGLTR